MGVSVSNDCSVGTVAGREQVAPVTELNAACRVHSMV